MAAEAMYTPFTEMDALEIAASVLESTGREIDPDDDVDYRNNRILLAVEGGRFQGTAPDILVLLLNNPGSEDTEPTFDLSLLTETSRVPIEDDCPAKLLPEAIAEVEAHFGCKVRAF